jgi:hypothetical protein
MCLNCVTYLLTWAIQVTRFREKYAVAQEELYLSILTQCTKSHVNQKISMEEQREVWSEGLKLEAVSFATVLYFGLDENIHQHVCCQW